VVAVPPVRRLGGLTADEAGNANFGQEELAIFFQDQWFYSPT
jgi:hypothetical protein